MARRRWGNGPAPFSHHGERRVTHDDAEDEVEPAAGENAGQVGPGDRASGGRQFQEHGDAQIRHSLPHVGRGRAAGGCDHGHDRRPNGVTDVEVEEKRESGYQHDPAAQPQQRPEQAGSQGDGEGRESEFYGGHMITS